MDASLKTALSQIQVGQYLEYREFLGALYHQLKQVKASYSYLQFAEDLGFSKTNVLRLVISGQRRLAPKSAATIAQNLPFQAGERRYFVAMVAYNNAKGRALRDAALDELVKIKRQLLPNDVDKRAVDYFSNWTHPVIRELARLQGQRAGGEDLRAALYPELRVRRAEEVVEFLKSCGFVTTTDEGTLASIDEKQISLPGDAAAGHLSLLSFHEEMLDVAKECLKKVPPKERDYNALTLCLSTDNYLLFKKKLRNLLHEFMTIESQDANRERVVQLNTQIFMLSKKPKGEDP